MRKWQLPWIAPTQGDGLSGNLYQIASLENLDWIRENEDSWNKYFIQIADINTRKTYSRDDDNGGAAECWKPIGYSEKACMG